MKKLLGIFGCLTLLCLMSHNAYADTTERVQNRNPNAIVYNYVNSDDNTTTANVVNRQTQLITKNVAANSSERVFLRKIRLNQAFDAAPNRTMVVPLTIRVYGYNDVFFNQPFDMSADFSCPYMTIREDAKWYVNYCTIKSSSTHFVQDGYVFDADGNMSLDGNGEYAYQYYIDYYIDIVIKFKNEFQADHLEFYYQPILALNNHSGTSAKNIAWQFIFNDFIYLYVDNDPAAAAIEEQNDKDEQDRSNIDNQQGDIDSSADGSTENMNNATSNITGIVSTFLGNLNNLNRNNCTLPNISAYGFSLGQLNLCTFQPPQWVRTVTSAVVSLIVLSMAVHVFKRIMRIAKGIAGSK